VRRLRVAVPGPQSGPRAAYGELIRKAVAGLGSLPQLEIRLLDDKAEPTVAARVAAAIVKDGIDVVVGHFNSDCARAAMPVYQAAGVPLLLPASTASGLADGRSVFRLCADESRQAEAIVALWRGTLHGRRPSVWSDGSAYAIRLCQQLETAFGSTLPDAPQPDDIGAAKGAVVAYCGSHVAVLERFAEEGSHWPGTAVCCDDCFVDEFDSQARPGTWVCAPHADYGRLLQEAIVVAHRILALKTARWQDVFDAEGEHRNAAWRMHKVGQIQ
jgi:branched-chain amino acid transport system substrate-binding protein